MIYQFRQGTPASVPPITAEATYNELHAVAERRGELTPSTLADDVEARGRDHPLGWAFTWDQAQAVRKLHEIEAGHLIRLVYVNQIVEEQPAPVRALVLIRDEKGKRYEPMTRAIRVKSQRDYVLQEAQEELAEFVSKMNELLALFRLLP